MVVGQIGGMNSAMQRGDVPPSIHRVGDDRSSHETRSAHLPCWVPEVGEFAGFLETDTTLAAITGLVCRPVNDTVADTWRWLQLDGTPKQRQDRDVHGLPAEVELRILAGG